jgi:hypothetical protein
MNEASLAIVRKVVLCAGLLVATLLFAYPHWRIAVEVENGVPAFDQDAGRAFILSPPSMIAQAIRVPMIGGFRPVFRINYVRQFIEVAIALLFTFGLMRALRKPLGNRNGDDGK